MRFLTALVPAALLASCATTAAEPVPDMPPTPTAARQLEMLVGFLTGTFASIPGQPGNADPTPAVVHQARLWPERPGEYWIYAEYARPGAESAPYRQRIYRFRASGDEIHAITYRLPGEPGRHALEWRKQAPFAGVDPATLAEREGCRLRFAARHLAIFGGMTVGRQCPGDAPEVAYEISDFQVSSSSIRTWDRGFDAAGRQVWGSTEGPLELRKISEQPR